jgi:GT2 family glycosyltransferase
MTCHVSIVLCTRNRAAQLDEALQSFTRIRTTAPWELIIVDNGSTDGTASVIEEFRRAWPGRVTMLHEPIPGVSRCKNRGWHVAAADIVFLTDDDCYPDPDLLTRIEECLGEDPRLGFVGGRVLLHDPADARVTIQESETRALFPPDTFVEPGKIHGANLAIRKTVLEAVGGFDERFGPGTRFIAEDTELMTRVLAAGWYGAYDPRPLVYHHHRRKSGAGLLRVYDRGRGAWYAKCLLNPALRVMYAKNWYWSALRQPWTTTLRELAGAAEFIFRHGVRAPREVRR